ncbi:MAG: YbdK family carboxylate-amine ligase, partial [Deltaproteobacteria bacterium]
MKVSHVDIDIEDQQMGADPRSFADDAAGQALAPITFPGCSTPSLGVELEVSLVDRESRNLTPRAPEVLALLQDATHAKPELFRTIIELCTGVCATAEQVRQDLRGRLQRLWAVCEPLGIGCMCTGSHPIADWRHMPISEDPRYFALVEKMAWPARRLLICGMHVHVGVKTGEHALAIMNAIKVFLPHFLALSASSPWWHGIDTGMASCRAKVFEGLPTAGLPPAVGNWGEFVSLMRTLRAAESIRSIREIWWDVRPHPLFGTLELRICDGVNSLDEVAALTALYQCLVVYLGDMYDQGVPLPSLRTWTLAENKWRAARYGEQAKIIRNERGEQVLL